MIFRRLLATVAAATLLAAMFLAVHRGARGRALTEEITDLTDRQAAAEVRKGEARRTIEELRSRTRIVRVAQGLGFHVPTEDELVILDLGGVSPEIALGRAP